MRLFGREIQIQEKGCSYKNRTLLDIAPMVNLNIKVTDKCNASCRFCCNMSSHQGTRFDVDKLFRIIDEIRSCGLRLHRVSITGGEPSIVPDVVEAILKRMDENPYLDIPIKLNTNGLSAVAHSLMRHPRWDSISLSLHHYDMEKLAEIYGIGHDKLHLNLDGVDRSVLSCSCNLIKGWIDSAKEVQHMMDYVVSKFIHTMGFVVLMPTSPYCQSHYVGYDSICFAGISGMMQTKEHSNGNYCRCRNYIYQSPNGSLDVYVRQTIDPLYCASSLLYDGTHLRQGFQSDNIIF